MQTTQDVVFLADPGESRHAGVREMLRQEGYDVVAMESLHQFMQYLSESAPMAVIVTRDYRVGGGGWVVANQVRELRPALPVFLLAYAEQPPVEGTCPVLTWPVSRDELRAALSPVGGEVKTLEKCAKVVDV